MSRKSEAGQQDDFAPPVPPPPSGPTSFGQEPMPRQFDDGSVGQSGRTHRMGLVGYPNSGKTSWLYSLVYGHKLYQIVRGDSGAAQMRRSWVMGSDEKSFASLIGRAGAKQEATRRGYFKSSRFCEMKRLWFPGLSIGTRFWLEIPEVSGETVKNVAEGGRYESADEQRAAEEYLEFLGECETIMCLVGLDCGSMPQDGVVRIDHALAPSINGFGRVLGEAVKRRRDVKHRIAVCILITKADLLKSSASIDEVELPRAKSSLHALVAGGGFEGLARELEQAGSDAEHVRFRVNPLLQSSVARGDLRIQECMTADFLRCHAPQAAQNLATLCGNEHLDVRFYLCAPYGRNSLDAKGASVFPNADALKPTMVYEPLENLLERAWRERAGSRLRRNAMWAAAASLLLGLLGPLDLVRRESAFDASIRESAPWREAYAHLDGIGAHPLHQLEIGFFDVRRQDHARRVLELRDRMVAGEVDELAANVIELEDRALELDPAATITVAGRATPLADHVAVRERKILEDYLLGRAAADEAPMDPARIGAVDLSSGEVVNFVRFLNERCRERRSAEQWRSLAARLSRIDLLSKRGDDPIQLRAAGDGDRLVSALERIAAAAEVRQVLEDSAVFATLGLERIPALIDAAARAGDLDALQALDALVRTRLDARWDAIVSRGDGDPLSALRAILDEPPEQEWLRGAHRQRARAIFESWFESLPGRVDERLAGAAQDADDPDLRGAEAIRIRQAVAELSRIGGAIESLRVPANRWILAGLDAEASGAIVAELAGRQELIDGLGGVERFTPSWALAIATGFERADDGLTLTLGRSDGSKSVLALAELARRQRELLESRFEELVDALVEESRLPEADQVLIAHASLAGATDAEGGAALLAVAKSMSESRPDLDELRSSLDRLLEGRGRLERYGAILVGRLRRTDAFPRIVLPLLEAIAASPAGVDARRAFAQRLVGQVAPERWSELDSGGLRSVMSELCDAGMQPREAGLALGKALQAAAVSAPTDALRRPQVEKLTGVIQESARRSGPESCVAILGPSLRALRETFLRARSRTDLDDESDATRIIATLRLLEEDAASATLTNLVDAAEAHRRRVIDWDLIRIDPGGSGSVVAQPGPFWLGRYEWTVDDVGRVIDADRGTLSPLRFDPDFPFMLRGSQRSGKGFAGEPPQNLRITKREHAEALVRAAGLRLPTRAEWLAAHARHAGVRPRPPSGGAISDCDPAALEKLGDRQDDGVVGLHFGVREWVQEGISGGSNTRPDADSKDEPPSPYDSGLRPALDALPAAFSRIPE